jgi:hypothetical protein
LKKVSAIFGEWFVKSYAIQPFASTQSSRASFMIASEHGAKKAERAALETR